ncbi:MAG: chorismate-binding protein, partial [Thermoanaerobaculum sp.]|nr:chorismate-binding protein [Thermoanaerobaculum sp.]
MTYPDLATFRRWAAEAPAVPLVRELTADTVTPFGMLLRLARWGRHPFLLESVEGGERVARWSLAGANPLRVITLQGGVVQVDGVPQVGEPVALLHRHLVGRGRARFEPCPPFVGGAVGYLAYDVVRYLERLPQRLPDPLGLPEAWFGDYRAVAALDRVRQRLLLVVTPEVERVGPEEGYRQGLAQLDELARVLASPLDAAAPAEIPEERLDVLPAQVAPGEEEFLRAVVQAKEAIAAGEIFQIVLSRRWSLPMTGSAYALYRALRLTNPSPYMFFLDTGTAFILGSSPETLARLRGDVATTCPIAGTRRRGRTPEEDVALERELEADEKERAEHLMLVDLGRNDLGRVCQHGSVQVVRFMAVERYSQVMHLVSEVCGQLRPGKNALDLLLACFPAGTLTGAPKVRAMELIEDWEPVRRGVYGGAVGYFDLGGDMDACIAIRTAVVCGGQVHLQAGAGGGLDSLPQRGLAGCRHKVRAVQL